ncbi:hypothetical protein DXG01_004709 [Tephrocybe rancida]|nr:hypothetical protein DXG01_004709 [Tephrocybe rancida]
MLLPESLQTLDFFRAQLTNLSTALIPVMIPLLPAVKTLRIEVNVNSPARYTPSEIYEIFLTGPLLMNVERLYVGWSTAKDDVSGDIEAETARFIGDLRGRFPSLRSICLRCDERFAYYCKTAESGEASFKYVEFKEGWLNNDYLEYVEEFFGNWGLFESLLDDA